MPRKPPRQKEKSWPLTMAARASAWPLPLRMDGTRGEMAEEAERFAQRVRKQVGVAVEMVDERLTSWEAERQLEEQFGRRSKAAEASSKKKAQEKISVDSMAATIILREYLARQGCPASEEARPR